MKTLVILAHPNLAQSTVNRAWADALTQQSEHYTVHELYRRYPGGRIDVAAEQALVDAHAAFILQFPVYWFNCPPLLKQWLDDVLVYGWAYGGGQALTGKEWLSVISTGGPADSYQAGGYNRFAMSEFLKPLVQTAHLLQMTFLPPFIFHGAVRADAGAVAASAEQLATYVHDPLLDPVKRLAALQAQMTQDGVKLG